jgi:hypothetical protein
LLFDVFNHKKKNTLNGTALWLALHGQCSHIQIIVQIRMVIYLTLLVIKWLSLQRVKHDHKPKATHVYNAKRRATRTLKQAKIIKIRCHGGVSIIC